MRSDLFGAPNFDGLQAMPAHEPLELKSGSDLVGIGLVEAFNLAIGSAALPFMRKMHKFIFFKLSLIAWSSNNLHFCWC